METLLQQLNDILIQPPGNLIYHLILAFSVFASLQTALITSGAKQNWRLLLGLNLILLAQLALFLVSGLAWQGVVSSHLFLPPFERAIIVFSLLWIGWLWAFSEQSARTERRILLRLGMGLLNLGILVLFFFTYTQWAREGASIAFNNTWMDWAWSFTGVGVILLSIVAVVIRRPEGWTLGLGMALLNLAGLLAHIFLSPPEGDYSSLIRLAQLAAYPLLPGLVARQSRAAAITAAANAAADSPSAQRATRAIDPRSIHAWVDLNLQSEPAQICTGVARAVAQSLLADLCYVATAPDGSHNPVILQGGYDLIREDAVPGTILEQDRIPVLTNALQKARGLRILAGESKTADLQSLSDALGLKDVGNLLLIPLTRGGAAWGGLLLLSPYSNRAWSTDEMNSLAAESETITSILSRAQDQFDNRHALERSQETVNSLSLEVENLRQQLQRQQNELVNLRATPSFQPGSGSAEMEALLAVQQETQEMLGHLQAENTRLRSILARPDELRASDNQQAESELRLALQEIARLQNQLVLSNSRLLEMERLLQNEPEADTQNREGINSLIQEMRQPMSSIMGYTDLLLAESLGILGKGQRNFVERIRTSGDRLRIIIDDLVNLTAANNDAGQPDQFPVELSDILDQAVAEIRPLLFERGIQLHVDLPEHLPALHADRDSLQQIIGHLLQNASSATPPDASIGLRARLWHEENNEFIILQVTDSGGGIANDDLPRVFARHYGAEKAPVSGTGDNGVGLALTKTLTLALGGRIWVESVPGRTTTFTVLLPTRPYQVVPASSQEISTT